MATETPPTKEEQRRTTYRVLGLFTLAIAVIMVLQSLPSKQQTTSAPVTSAPIPPAPSATDTDAQGISTVATIESAQRRAEIIRGFVSQWQALRRADEKMKMHRFKDWPIEVVYMSDDDAMGLKVSGYLAGQRFDPECSVEFHVGQNERVHAGDWLIISGSFYEVTRDGALSLGIIDMENKGPE